MNTAATFTIETEQEVDSRWIADVVEIPGAMAYGPTRDRAIANAQAIALRVLRNVSNTGRQAQNSLRYPSKRHDESMAQHSGQKSFGRSSTKGVDDTEAVRFS